MRKDLTESLYTEFPDLYWQHALPMTQTCLCWGFACGDGWYNIIHALSTKIQSILASNPDLDPRLFTAIQVKEKFGQLRFYMSRSTSEITKAISEAERESAKTCEMCGGKGKLRGTDWLSTLCGNCWEKRQSERRPRAGRRQQESPSTRCISETGSINLIPASQSLGSDKSSNGWIRRWLC